MEPSPVSIRLRYRPVPPSVVTQPLRAATISMEPVNRLMVPPKQACRSRNRLPWVNWSSPKDSVTSPGSPEIPQTKEQSSRSKVFNRQNRSDTFDKIVAGVRLARIGISREDGKSYPMSQSGIEMSDPRPLWYKNHSIDSASRNPYHVAPFAFASWSKSARG